jgi:hypothetical protein
MPAMDMKKLKDEMGKIDTVIKKYCDELGIESPTDI